MSLERMLDAASKTLEKIYKHPFNTNLSDGSLSKERFHYFLQQDAHYLPAYASALVITAQRLSNESQSTLLMRFSSDTLTLEQALHKKFLVKYQAPNLFKPITIQPSDVCVKYKNHLLTTAQTASVAEALASLLPCFWIYHELGKQMEKSAKDEENPYHDWIITYAADQTFTESVSAFIQIITDLAQSTSDNTQTSMISAFAQSVEFEHSFFEDAYSSFEKEQKTQYTPPIETGEELHHGNRHC